MRRLDRLDLEHTMRLIAEGEWLPSRADIGMALLSVRFVAPRGSQLQDLAHAVAHDRRDKGYGFDYLQNFVKELLTGFETGKGQLHVKTLWPIRRIIGDLNAVLEHEGLDVRLDGKSDRVRKALALSIGLALAGTSFKLSGTTATLMMISDEEEKKVGLYCRVDLPKMKVMPDFPGYDTPWMLAPRECTDWEEVIKMKPLWRPTGLGTRIPPD
ncbi:hypothetical protein [Microbacterium sp. P02]|uniref:hypothetical protein n=1 Tax=Microbacterium sp. P02 TaxID=3366260 RepID=UPI00366BCB1D